MSRAGRATGVATIAAGALLAALLGGCGSSSSNEYSFTGSGYPNVDLANTRSAESTIDSSNVDSLSEVWRAVIPGIGALGRHSSTPVIAGGVVYSQDLGSNVQALDLESGDVIWKRTYEESTPETNGVTVVEGSVFGVTPKEAFALDRETGREIWSMPLVRGEQEGISMAPGYSEGTVYVSTMPVVNPDGSYKGGGVGVLWALDAKTGKKLWHFDTVPKGLWGNPKLNSGGGLRNPPAFDGKGGMYFGTGNPGPVVGNGRDAFGSSRPGPNLYTNSLVKLDAKTGKLEWYHQVTPHDIYGWDFQGPPILMNVGGRETVVAAGRAGVVLAADAKSGKVLWQTSVGRHNGHDDDGLLAMRGEESRIEAPATVYPGMFGGVIAPMSTDGKLLFVPVVNVPLGVLPGGKSRPPNSASASASGEVVAIDPATGKIEWKKGLTGPPYGGTTVVNDLVFATDYPGTLFAFDTKTGRLLWKDGLSAGTNAGIMAAGDTLVAPAGLAVNEGETSGMAAYRLGG